MSSESLHTDVMDLLPEYARGDRSRADRVEAHLETCEDCRVELEFLRALSAPIDAMSDIERARTYRAFEARRGAGGRPGPAWLRASWRAAAGVALLLTSVGVWQVVQTGSPADWDPDAAVDVLVQDIADLGLSEGDVRMALGGGWIDDPTVDLSWDEPDVDGVSVPWEEN